MSESKSERDTRVVESDGLDLVVESAGSGPTILFCHGLSGNRSSVFEQFAPLSSSHRIVAFDQRGHGDSSAVSNPDLFEPKRMSRDLGVVLDAIGVSSAIVGGESMGAALAMLFASENPSRVDRLLLTAPAFGDQPNPERERLHGMAQIIQAKGIDAFLKGAAIRQREEWGAPESVIEKLAVMQRSHDPASLALACQTVIDWVIVPKLEDFASFDRPACVVGWPDDGLHPEGLARRYAGVLPGASLSWLSSMFEVFERPAAVGEIYRQFLSDSTGGLPQGGPGEPGS